MNPLSEWQNFYVVLGSAAGALTGLQFVTMALIADMPMTKDDLQAGDSFSTPTVVHFCTVLLLAAILVAPWHGIAPAAVIWGMAGGLGVAYTFLTGLRMRAQKAYQAVLED